MLIWVEYIDGVIIHFVELFVHTGRICYPHNARQPSGFVSMSGSAFDFVNHACKTIGILLGVSN